MEINELDEKIKNLKNIEGKNKDGKDFNINEIITEIEKDDEDFETKDELVVYSEAPVINRNGFFEKSVEVMQLEDKFQKKLKSKYKNENEVVTRLRELCDKNTSIEGIVCGVYVENKKLYIQVVWNQRIIIIKDEDYFDSTMQISKNYGFMNDAEKLEAKKQVARQMLGARCPASIEKIEVRKEDGFIIYGNRLKALKKLRDFFYYGIGMEDKSFLVTKGREVDANVVYANEEFVTVEICGYETRIDSFNLSETKYSPNCSDELKPGDVMRVRIKSVYKEDESGKEALRVSATGRLINELYTNEKVCENGTYLGFITKYNHQKGIYTVTLSNGVTVAVHENAILGNSICIGDRVSVLVKAIKDYFAIGFAKKI